MPLIVAIEVMSIHPSRIAGVLRSNPGQNPTLRMAQLGTNSCGTPRTFMPIDPKSSGRPDSARRRRALLRRQAASLLPGGRTVADPPGTKTCRNPFRAALQPARTRLQGGRDSGLVDRRSRRIRSSRGTAENPGGFEQASRIPASTSVLVCPSRIAEETLVETHAASELSPPGEPERSGILNSGARPGPQVCCAF